MTTAYLQDTAEQAGLRTRRLAVKEIGWDSRRNGFADLENDQIITLFKLYPWEWLLDEAFAQQALSTLPPASPLVEYGPRKDRRSWGSMLWIEPIWKMMWSNKALLAILWELNPGHELLLPAYLDGPRDMQSYIRKPLFGREGAGIALVRNGVTEFGSLESSAPKGYVYQALAPMAQAGGDGSLRVLAHRRRARRHGHPRVRRSGHDQHQFLRTASVPVISNPPVPRESPDH